MLHEIQDDLALLRPETILFIARRVILVNTSVVLLRHTFCPHKPFPYTRWKGNFNFLRAGILDRELRKLFEKECH